MPDETEQLVPLTTLVPLTYLLNFKDYFWFRQHQRGTCEPQTARGTVALMDYNQKLDHLTAQEIKARIRSDIQPLMHPYYLIKGGAWRVTPLYDLREALQLIAQSDDPVLMTVAELVRALQMMADEGLLDMQYRFQGHAIYHECRLGPDDDLTSIIGGGFAKQVTHHLPILSEFVTAEELAQRYQLTPEIIRAILSHVGLPVKLAGLHGNRLVFTPAIVDYLDAKLSVRQPIEGENDDE